MTGVDLLDWHAALGEYVSEKTDQIEARRKQVISGRS